MGFSFGIGASKSKTTTEPWAPQGNILKNTIYPAVKDLFGQGSNAAQITPEQLQAYGGAQSLYDLSGQVANTFGQAGAQLTPGLGQAANYYGNTVANGVGYQNPFANGIDMNLVNQVANNPTVDGMVQASLRDPYRQLTEQTMPGIASSAVGSGNTGSSRRGIAEGIAQRGYGDRAADISSQIRFDAYNQGLGFAGQSADYNQQGQMADISGRQFAAQNLAGLGQAGLGYTADQYNFGQTGAQNLSGWGDYYQNLQKQLVDEPWRLLQMASGITQANNWGGTTSGSNVSANIGFGGK
jgi:hypothetical protein